LSIVFPNLSYTIEPLFTNYLLKFMSINNYRLYSQNNNLKNTIKHKKKFVKKFYLYNYIPF